MDLMDTAPEIMLHFTRACATWDTNGMIARPLVKTLMNALLVSMTACHLQDA